MGLQIPPYNPPLNLQMFALSPNFLKHPPPVSDLLVLKPVQPVTRPTSPIIGPPRSDGVDDYCVGGISEDSVDFGGDVTTQMVERWNGGWER